MATEETGSVTGTRDKDYNLIWFTEQSLSNALRLESYIEDARRGIDAVDECFDRLAAPGGVGAEHVRLG